MKIYFVRHSEVIKPYQGKYNGHIDIALSLKGKEDAKKIAQKLSHIKFDKAFCSDLLRTKETIKEFCLDIPICYTDALREKSWGKYEGKSYDEIVQDGIVYKNFSQWIKALGGESIEAFSQRVWSFFQKDLLSLDEEDILVVTHAGVIKMLIAIEKKIALEEAFSLPLSYGDIVVYDSKKGFMI